MFLKLLADRSNPQLQLVQDTARAPALTDAVEVCAPSAWECNTVAKDNDDDSFIYREARQS